MRISDWSSDVCSSDLLAGADEPGRAANGDQLAAFRAVAAHFPDVPASIANSGGVFLPADFHADLARPGVALFGVDPGPNAQGLCPVVRLDARVLQIRTIEAGTGVGSGLDIGRGSGRERVGQYG